MNHIVHVNEQGGVLNWEYNGWQWQTWARQKKLNTSYFTRHVPIEQRIPLELRYLMVNYHNRFYNY